VAKAGRDQSNRASTDIQSLTFEQALAEVESIIERIEAGEIGLEDALAQYERGVALVNHCRGKLDRAQQKVEDLTRRLEQTDDEGSAARPPGPGASEADDPEP
jgi:exodeoxyribonuclease VII small subunit